MSDSYIVRRGLNNTTATLTFNDVMPGNLVDGPYLIDSPIKIFDGCGSGSVDKYVLFAGGEQDPSNPDDPIVFNNAVYAIDNNLVVTSITALAQARSYMASASNNYVLFAGGRFWNSSASPAALDGSKIVDAYDSSLVHTTFNLATMSVFGAGANTSDYFLIAGGYEGASVEAITSNTIYVYNTSLVAQNDVDMTYGRANFSGATFKNMAWFGGTDNSLYAETVELVDNSMVHKEVDNLQAGRQNISICATKSQILFVGGLNEEKEEVGIVDVYTVNSDGTITHSVGRPLDGVTSGNKCGSFSLAAIFSKDDSKTVCFSDKLEYYDITNTTGIKQIIAATNSSIVYYPVNDKLLYFKFNSEKSIHIYRNSSYNINGNSGTATDDMDLTEEFPINGTINVVSTSYS